MKKTGSEQDTPAEPLERARLQAEVAKQRVRIAKEELKRARKRLKEASPSRSVWDCSVQGEYVVRCQMLGWGGQQFVR